MEDNESPFERISAKAQPSNSNGKNPFASRIPEVTRVNKKVIQGSMLVVALIVGYAFYEFAFPEAPDAKKENPNEIRLSDASGKVDDITTYKQLQDKDKMKNGRREEPLPSRQQEQPYNGNRYYAQQTPPIRPNAQPPAILPGMDFDSPLAFTRNGRPPVEPISAEGGVMATGSGNGDFRSAVRQSKDFYNPADVQEVISPYEVKAGTVIPSTMITGINSDLPGVMIAQVTENIYDTVSGRYLLLPQGTKLIGQYNSDITYGQDRVQVIWSRLIMPNGDSLDLNGAIGADLAGYSGISGRVNNHTNKLVNGALATSAFAILISSTTKTKSDSDSDPASVVAENMSQIADKITSRAMEIQPTIEVEPGTQFNILVDQDLILRPYRSL